MVDTYLELLNPWCETPLGTGQFNMPVYSAESARIESLLGELGWRNAAAPSSIAKSSLGEPATSTASWIALTSEPDGPPSNGPPSDWDASLKRFFNAMVTIHLCYGLGRTSRHWPSKQ